MAAGVSDHVWKIREIIAPLDSENQGMWSADVVKTIQDPTAFGVDERRARTSVPLTGWAGRCRARNRRATSGEDCAVRNSGD